MKIINKASASVLGLIFIGSSVFAQSLADAKKAIDAEQYQKAKSMLKNLTVTQSTKDENYFYLGLVYINQDYADSARLTFNKGIAINPKSALNIVGLGTVDRIDKNDASAKANFDRALALAGKDDKPYIYVAKAYLIKPYASKEAIAVLEKAKTLSAGAKDPELFTTLGDAYRSEGDSNNAYLSYNQATTLDPNSPVIIMNIGVLWKQANNYEDADKQFQTALTKDPNFGPAYRELAESDLQQAKTDPKVASVKVKEGADYYKKYLDLTDRSPESRMRYADFLINAGDYKTLEQEANALAQTNKSDLRIYRYLAYSAYENGNYTAGMDAINKWMKSADPKRIIPRDYLYLGRLQLKTGQDSLGVQSLRKALELDTTQVDLYGEIAASLYSKQKYLDAANAYDMYIKKARAKLGDYVSLGRSYFYAFSNQQDNFDKTKIKPDTSLLTKADTAFSYVNHKVATPIPSIILLQAYVADARETDRANNYKGYAKPYYEQYISLVAPKNPTDDYTKHNLVNAYAYLGYYYEFVAKDEAKAADNWNKAKDIDPTNKQVQAYFTRHAGATGKGK
jgi:tetratricopeptide (TPR) repeat protein